MKSKTAKLSPLEELFVGWVQEEFQEEVQNDENTMKVELDDISFAEILTGKLRIVLYKAQATIAILLNLKDITLEDQHFASAAILANEINQCCVNGYFQVLPEPILIRYRHSINFTDADIDQNTFNAIMHQTVVNAIDESSYPERLKSFAALRNRTLDAVLTMFTSEPESLPPMILASGDTLH